MLDSGFSAGGEDFLVVDEALTEICALGASWTAQIDRRTVHRLEFLDVDHLETSGIFLEVGDRIGTPCAHPAAVDFELHEIVISVVDEDIVAEGSVRHLFEFIVVVVIGVLKSGCLGLDADIVHLLGEFFEAVESQGRHCWAL